MSSTLSIERFDYNLPGELIAQRPAERRTGSRLLGLERSTGGYKHFSFEDFPGLLRDGDLLVINDTMVFPARLMAKRATGGVLEILLLEYPSCGGETACLVRPGRRIRKSEQVFLEDGSVLHLRRSGEGFAVSGDKSGLRNAVQALGKVPLPPYISRDDDGADASDAERYQTVFAEHPGAVAAPTAGLHFDNDMLMRIRERGIGIAHITLHVGPGTFQPVRSIRLDEHKMDLEDYFVPDETAGQIELTKKAGGRIVAVGTTVVRTLESAWDGRRVKAGKGRTGLFIYPDYNFKVVDALLTNFHLPRSTLILLVCAFGGTDHVMKSYREAVREKYRFYSYGDAMFIE